MNLAYCFPLFLVIGSYYTYHNLLKNQPQGVNPYLSLCIAYVVCVIVTFILFLITNDNNVVKELGKLNWISYVLGIAIAGVEIGYTLAYRNGWHISICALIATVAVSTLLVFTGVLFYKESFSIQQIIGVILCLSGLILIK